ncbi:hemerythrin domain-containing protein [Aldersonia kunmingensis]|uniref:hemerythrin domain-containing protein n=1 Tax=Aldersonia kunmingensis TaxID=408066 RepID=UPI000834E259|nr:hemerythrin domain-containing protein [Aldersonia kunmingensis]
MTIQSNAPADTRMMGIVHDALRRDLGRTREVLSATTPPDDAQRVAIADHVLWMMRFLHMHHGAEDLGFWPLVRSLNPDAAALLDQLDADHTGLVVEINRVATTATRYRADESPDALEALASAIDGLESELLPHLRREEDEMMPIVSRTLTRAQWDELDQALNIAPKSQGELAIEGHWLIDGLDEERYNLVVHQVPVMMRFVLLHGYGRAYRHACGTRWGRNVEVTPRAKRRAVASTEPAAIPSGSSFRNEGSVSLCIAASPEQLYEIVADVTRVGERSPECRSCAWLPGRAPGTVGARFRGRNKSGRLGWSRVCEVVVSEPGVEFTFRTIPERFDPSRRDSTTWSYSFAPNENGTRVTHSYRVTKLPLRAFFWLYGKVLPHHRDMRPQMQANLEVLREQAERKWLEVPGETSAAG